MDFAFVSLGERDDRIWLATPARKALAAQAEVLRGLLEDDSVGWESLWKPVIELGREALFVAAAEGKDEVLGPIWQMGAMALAEPSRLGQHLGQVKQVASHLRNLGEKVELRAYRWLGRPPSEREMAHLAYQMVEEAEMARWGATPAKLAWVGGAGMYLAGYLGLKLGRPEAGVAFAVLAAMDELEALDEQAGDAAVACLRERGLDIWLGAAMPYLFESEA